VACPRLAPSLEGFSLESHRSRKRNKEVCRAIGRTQACAERSLALGHQQTKTHVKVNRVCGSSGVCTCSGCVRCITCTIRCALKRVPPCTWWRWSQCVSCVFVASTPQVLMGDEILSHHIVTPRPPRPAGWTLHDPWNPSLPETRAHLLSSKSFCITTMQSTALQGSTVLQSTALQGSTVLQR
jgi:hypothetical protein